MLAIITVTPLQIAIGRKILEDRGIEKFVSLNINAHDSETLKRQYAKLSESAVDANYLILNESGLRNLAQVKAVLKKWKRLKISELLFASIDNVFVQHVVGKFSHLPFCTFDDGAVNLISAGVYHQKQLLTLTQSLKYKLLRGSVDQDWIKQNTAKHYTIFDIDKNIVAKSRLQVISVFTDEIGCELSVVKNKVAKVFVGFHHSEKYLGVVNQVNADFYLPHPMEPFDHSIINRIQTNLIAEEYIGALLDSYENVHVFACASTVLWNLRSNRIQRYVVDLFEKGADWQNEYNLISRELGCNIVAVADLPYVVAEIEKTIAAKKIQ